MDKLWFSFGIREQIVLMERLSFYLHAGVPILEALHLISEDSKHPHVKKVLATLIARISEGHSISSSLALFPKQISRFVIAMVQIGEQSGTLPQTLREVAQGLTQQQRLRDKAIGSLIYPVIIVCSVIGIASFLMLYAFPKIVPLFKGFGSELPLPTRLLIGVTEFSSKYGVYALLVITGLCIGTCVALHYPRIQLLRDQVLIYIPYIGTWFAEYNRAQVARTLAVLLRSGVGLIVALELTRQTVGSPLCANHIEAVQHHVLSGKLLSEACTEFPDSFPSLFIHMIRTGERTGSLPQVCEALATHYEVSFETKSTRMALLVEPVLMIVLGVLVGFIALAIITPVYQITQHLHA